MIYLDNNATTVIDPECLRTFNDSYSRFLGSPESFYPTAKSGRDMVDRARSEILECLQLGNDWDLLFTSGGTESNLLGVLGVLKANTHIRQLIISGFEHSSLHGFLKFSFDGGMKVLECPFKESAPNLEFLESACAKSPSLVCLMHVSNENGVILPLREASRIVRRHGGILFSDMVQSIGKINVEDVWEHVDIASFSSHKFHGPLGTGGLIHRKSVPVAPPFPGGLQERGVRSGTLNLPGILATHQILRSRVGRVNEEQARILQLRDRLEQFIGEMFPEAVVLGKNYPRAAHTLSVAIPGLLAEDFITILGESGVCIGKTSACQSKAGFSHVLENMGLEDVFKMAAVRFSFSGDNTADEIEKVITLLPECVSRARAMGPMGGG